MLSESRAPTEPPAVPFPFVVQFGRAPATGPRAVASER